MQPIGKLVRGDTDQGLVSNSSLAKAINKLHKKQSLMIRKQAFKWTLVLSIFLSLFFCDRVFAQQSIMKVRIAKLVIDYAYLSEYRTALAEHAATAVKLEPGVITLNAVYDKVHPTQVTVFEVYASDSAYQAHIKTPHFLKYKNGTLKMVKSLELVDVVPIALETKLIPKRSSIICSQGLLYFDPVNVVIC